MLVNVQIAPVTVNVIVYRVGVSTTLPEAAFAATISCITDSFCVPALSTAIVDFCSTPVLLVVTVTLIPVTVAPA